MTITTSSRQYIAAALKIIFLASYGFTGAVAGFIAVRSSIVPLQYVVALGALWLLGVGLIVWLFYKQFRRTQVAARLIGGLIVAISVTAIVCGMTIFTSALGVLDDISKDGTVTVDSTQPFYLFISGIDTFGELDTTSRSDVNILAGVNPVTRTVTLVSVPRDSYLPIALGGNDQYDKLTHAGNYGVESSMRTVGNLFGVDVNLYARINFTSFISGIDKLGGVTVHNPTAFSSFGEDFPAGDIYLTGPRALIYSRERKSLAGGDLDRGRNQQRVITAVIAKASSIRSLDGFQGLLDIAKESVQTNATSETIRQVINDQLARPSQWKTNTLELAGHGETGTRTSYAMPDAQLYMYILDEDSVESVRARLQDAMSAR